MVWIFYKTCWTTRSQTPRVVMLMLMCIILTSPQSLPIQPSLTSLSPVAYPACLLLTLGVARSLPTNVSQQTHSDRHIKMQIPASLLIAILSHPLSWEVPTTELDLMPMGWIFKPSLITSHCCTLLLQKSHLLFWLTTLDPRLGSQTPPLLSFEGFVHLLF